MYVEYPENYDPNRCLILAMLHSAIRDYFFHDKTAAFYNLNNLKTKEEKKAHYKEIARRFIFEDSYLMDWGDITISPSSLLEQCNIDLKEIRKMVQLKEKQGINSSPIKTLLGKEF